MIALLFCVGLIGSPEPSLRDVLARAAAYVAEFERQLSALAGEETYVQQARTFSERGCPSDTVAAGQATVNCGSLVNATRTELHSHLLLIRNGRSGYVQYRDVYEVDRRTIGDRAERFTRLFGDRSMSADEQKRKILEESARFNIGDVVRTMNVPLLALEFLSAENQWRFGFERTSNATARIGDPGEAPPGTFGVSTNVWVLEYREREPRTIVRTTEGRDIRSRGRLWVEPATGRVLMTELIIRNRDLETSVNVSFKSEPVQDLLVPVEMRERYQARSGSVIDAVATYGKFVPFRSAVDRGGDPVKE